LEKRGRKEEEKKKKNKKEKNQMHCLLSLAVSVVIQFVYALALHKKEGSLDGNRLQRTREESQREEEESQENTPPIQPQLMHQ
jgi:uncharacterized protein YqhQ